MKVVQIGNSGGILVPKQVRRELGIRIGEKVSAELKGKKMIITNPKTKKTTASVDAKFAKIVDEFMDEHKDVLSELANREGLTLQQISTWLKNNSKKIK